MTENDQKDPVEKHLTEAQQEELKKISEKLLKGTAPTQENSVQNLANVNQPENSKGK